MDPIFETVYFDWLYAKVHLDGVPFDTYCGLLKVIFRTEFVWLLSGDDNRAEDGTDLRMEFLKQNKKGFHSMSWFDDGCSVLEMFIALSRRAEFDTDIPSIDWFWRFINNLGLGDQKDQNFDIDYINEVLYRFVWRLYEYDGEGGLFPLRHPSRDQRTTELWYQFSEYINENEPY